MAGTHSQRVLTFLSDQGIAVKRKNKVTVDIDRSCEMAQVKVNGKVIMVGNFWDFHPGCHGFNGLPSFPWLQQPGQRVCPGTGSGSAPGELGDQRGVDLPRLTALPWAGSRFVLPWFF